MRLSNFTIEVVIC